MTPPRFSLLSTRQRLSRKLCLHVIDPPQPTIWWKILRLKMSFGTWISEGHETTHKVPLIYRKKKKLTEGSLLLSLFVVHLFRHFSTQWNEWWMFRLGFGFFADGFGLRRKCFINIMMLRSIQHVNSPIEQPKIIETDPEKHINLIRFIIDVFSGAKESFVVLVVIVKCPADNSHHSHFFFSHFSQPTDQWWCFNFSLSTPSIYEPWSGFAINFLFPLRHS